MPKNTKNVAAKPVENNSMTIEGVIDPSVAPVKPLPGGGQYHRAPLTLVNPEITHPTGPSLNDPLAYPPSGNAKPDLTRASLEPTDGWIYVIHPDGTHLEIHPEDLAEALQRVPGLQTV
jgi:hypothetical protein